MGCKTWTNYFEKWLITSTNYELISIVDLELKRDYTFLGEESTEPLQKLEELGESEFLDWFYNMGLNGCMDHSNYTLTQSDKEYLKSRKK